MNIKTKYKIWEEVYIVNEWREAIFKAYVSDISIDIDEEWKEIEYWLRVEIPVGETNKNYDYVDWFEEDTLFPSKREASAKLKELIEEEEIEKREKEERRAKYEELKNEFKEEWSSTSDLLIDLSTLL